MKTAPKTNANTPSQLEIDAVKALRTGSELTEAALEALEGLARSPKRLAALNALLDESAKPAESETKPARFQKIARPRLVPEEIVTAGRKFFELHGRLPSQNSREEVPGMPGETWAIINGAGREGNRGLAEGQTLAKLFVDLRIELKLTQRGRAVELTDSLLIAAALQHFDERGRWPSAASTTEIAGAAGIQWATVFKASYLGRRGFGPGRTIESLIERAKVLRSE